MAINLQINTKGEQIGKQLCYGLPGRFAKLQSLRFSMKTIIDCYGFLLLACLTSVSHATTVTLAEIYKSQGQ